MIPPISVDVLKFAGITNSLLFKTVVFYSLLIAHIIIGIKHINFIIIIPNKVLNKNIWPIIVRISDSHKMLTIIAVRPIQFNINHFKKYAILYL